MRERELEIQAAEARLAELGYHLCPHCDFEVEKDFLRCPNCMRKLKDPCRGLRQAARPGMEDLPVLRGRDRGTAPPTATRRTREPPRGAAQPRTATATSAVAADPRTTS